MIQALVAITLLNASASGEPVLESSSKEFDFGLSVHNSTLVHHVWLKSTGTDTVTISRITADCICTTSQLERDRIPPGDSVRVSVYWDTQRSLGIIRGYLRVFLDGKTSPITVGLVTMVSVVPDSGIEATVWPYKFELSRHTLKSIDSLSFRIKNMTDRVLKPIMTSEIPDQCEIHLPETVPPHSNAWGYIKVRPEYLEKEFLNSVTLSFANERKHILTIPIRRKFYMDIPRK